WRHDEGAMENRLASLAATVSGGDGRPVDEVKTITLPVAEVACREIEVDEVGRRGGDGGEQDQRDRHDLRLPGDGRRKYGTQKRRGPTPLPLEERGGEK